MAPEAVEVDDAENDDAVEGGFGIGVPPQPLPGTPPIIPDPATRAAMAKAGISSIAARLRVCVTETGAVERVTLVRSSGYPAYDRKLLGGVPGWTYEPFVLADKPIRTCMELDFEFPPPPVPLEPPATPPLVVLPRQEIWAAMKRDRVSSISATFKVCYDPSGQTETVELVQSSGYPAYDEQSLEKARRSTQEPVIIAGKPSRRCSEMRDTFTLEPTAAPPNR